MRDYICMCFVPALTVFPILHILLADKVVEEPSSKTLFRTELGLKIEGTNELFISLNEEDELVTCEAYKPETLQIWNLNPDSEKPNIFEQKVLLFISYVIGSWTILLKRK